MNIKKYLLLLIMTIILETINVTAEEKYTITYDANDGTGRTQVVELTNDKIIMPDITFFEVENLGDTDYLDNPVINSWNLNNNANLRNYSDTRYYSNYTYTIDDLFDNSKNITLYAEWQKRKSISPDDIYINEVYSGGKLYNGKVISCDIEPKRDFNINFSGFDRRSGQQFLYYKLPECFTDSLTNYLNNEMSVPLSLKEKINYLGTIMTYEGGFFYIKNNILFINFVDDGTTAYDKMNGIISVPFSIQYSFTFTNVNYNNRIIKKATVLGEANSQISDPSFDVYPIGNIKVKYIDKDSKEEIKKEDNYEAIIGDVFNITIPQIDGYEFFEKNEITEYSFEEEPKVITLEYVNMINKYNVNIEIKKETDNIDIELNDITQVKYKEEVTFKVTPAKGYKVSNIRIIDSDSNEIKYNTIDNKSYTFTMPASNVTIIPSYEKLRNNIIIEDNKNTKEIAIEVNDTTAVIYEEKVKFTIIPENEYEIEKIEIIDENNNIISYRKTSKNNEYEFIMPDTNVTIIPTYRKMETNTLKNPNTMTGISIVIIIAIIITYFSTHIIAKN